MRKIRTVVSRSDGKLEFVTIPELWAISGRLADTFPLDRTTVRGPRWARRGAHWTRLALVDRPLADPDRSAMLTLSATPWVPAVGAAVVAAVVAPKLPRWLRIAGFGGLVAWMVSGRRLSRYVAMRRALRDVAPGALLVGDFVALRPGAGTRWVAEALAAIGPGFTYVALVPESGNPRRDAARERLYARGLGLHRHGVTEAGGQRVVVLVLD
jgi:hypothetical protein